MCSTSLDYSFRDDHERAWKGNDPLPASAKDWLKGRKTSFSLGGTLRHPSKEEEISSYRAAAAFLGEFQAAFPELAGRLAIVREYNCHSECEAEQVYLTPEALLAETARLAAGRFASSLPQERSDAELAGDANMIVLEVL